LVFLNQTSFDPVSRGPKNDKPRSGLTGAGFRFEFGFWPSAHNHPVPLVMRITSRLTTNKEPARTPFTGDDTGITLELVECGGALRMQGIFF